MLKFEGNEELDTEKQPPTNGQSYLQTDQIAIPSFTVDEGNEDSTFVSFTINDQL